MDVDTATERRHDSGRKSQPYERRDRMNPTRYAIHTAGRDGSPGIIQFFDTLTEAVDEYDRLERALGNGRTKPQWLGEVRIKEST